MDLTTTPTKNPDAENETPPQTLPNTKSLSFTNCALKHHHLTAASAPPAAVVTYRECLKNHAASLGGHAVDGCGEYLPSPTATPTDRTSLKCAACGCHRNFHRREADYTTTATTLTTHFLDFRRHPPLPLPQPPRRNSPSTSPSSSPSPPPPPPPPPSSYYPSTPHMLLALSTAVQDRPTTNPRPLVTPVTPVAVKTEKPSGRKRFRTKFSQEQKEKMLSFSEKLGWKMQKCDEGLVEEFCNEVGVGKGVLKVWMHNNKHNFGKREINNTTITTITTTTNKNSSDRVISYDNNGHNINTDNTNKNNSDYHEDSSAHLHDSTDGSSSSS